MIGLEGTATPEDEGYGDPESGEGEFEGHALFSRRPTISASGGRDAEASQVVEASPPPASPQPDTHDNAVGEILATV